MDLDHRHVGEVADVRDADLGHSSARCRSLRTLTRCDHEPRGGRAVDHAVVVGQRQRHHQARHELATVPDRLHRRARDAEDRDLGRVDDRRERRPADPAERRDRERAALHVAGHQLAVARLARQLGQLARDLHQALLVGVLDHRHDEPAGRVGGEADVVVALEDQVVAVERRVERRELPSASRRTPTIRNDDHRDLDALARMLVVELLAPRLELGDVGLVVVRDVRDHHPVAGERRRRDPLDPRALHALDRRRTSRSRLSATAAGRARTAGRRPAPAAAAAGAGARGRTLCTSSLVIRPLRPLPVTGAGRRRARARAGAPPGSRRPARRRCPRDGSGPAAVPRAGRRPAAGSRLLARLAPRSRPRRPPWLLRTGAAPPPAAPRRSPTATTSAARLPAKPCPRSSPELARRSRPPARARPSSPCRTRASRSGSSTATVSPTRDEDLDHRHVGEVADVRDR